MISAARGAWRAAGAATRGRRQRTVAAEVKVARKVPDLELDERVVGHVFHVQRPRALQEQRLVRAHLVEDHALDARLATPVGAARTAGPGQRWIPMWPAPQAASVALGPQGDRGARLCRHGSSHLFEPIMRIRGLVSAAP